MKGFIIDSTYRILNDRPFVFLYGKLENEDPFVFVKHFRPYFFIESSKLKKAKKVEKFDYEETKLKTFDGKKVVKILADVPADVVHLREEFHDAEIDTFEADVQYARRFIIDKELRSSVEITGDYEYQEDVRVYKDAEIKPSDWKPKLKVLSLDIETNGKTGEVYVISIVSGKIKKSFVNNKKVKDAVNCKDEQEVIEKFVEEFRKIDPDVVTGWNLIDFDFNHLQERAREYDSDLMLGRDGSKIKLRITKDFFRTSTANITGRVVVDALNMIKSSFIKSDDYKLETVAKEVLGKGKLLKFKDVDKYEELDKLYKENPSRLVKYNVLDAELPLQILDKSGALDLAVQKSFITGMNLDRFSSSIASLDMLYLPKARKRGLVCPTLRHNEKKKGIKGGFVMEPKPGLYENILVLDFKSLYPSIIKTFNIDPASFVKSCRGKRLIKAPNGACFRNDDGILPSIISELWKEREKAAKQKNELARYAIKILMNSFFGVLASPNCRFFNMKIANAITHFGQHIIKLTKKVIEKEGYSVLYEDTDSCFVNIKKKKSLKEAEKIGKQLEKHINSYYKNHINKNFKRESFLEIEYEKCYRKFFMPKLRKTKGGAKKRYAGLLKKDKIDIVGLEFVRGDWTELAKKFQYKLLEKMFNEENVEKYIVNLVKKLKQGKLDDDLVYSKTLRKPISEYSVNPPHVKAAKKLGNLKSKQIRYIMTDEGPEPVQKLKHSIDYEHYINKQMKPIADSILHFFDTSFEDVLKGHKQQTLGSFS